VFKFTPGVGGGLEGDWPREQAAQSPRLVVAIDPRNGTLYVGTENGVYTEPEGTGPWKPLNIGMAGVSVHSLVLNQTTNVLLAGTYGGGVYELFLDTVQTAGRPP